MYNITKTISIDEREFEFSAIRASGPGGQNVNKVSTAVQLRFDIHKSTSIPLSVKQRLVKLAGSRVTTDGVLIIDARNYRTQRQNRDDAVKRLIKWVSLAAKRQKPRIPTKPNIQSNRNRLTAKRRRSDTKKSRKSDKLEFDS